ncbi:MAG: glycosyltransferase family 4 protein [Myxococcota bacterium]
MDVHILSFEGPDPYCRAGGIATRITGLATTLAQLGHETHLWFVGDPDLPGHDEQGHLHLHRWCQWISRHHPHGVYDGEEGKLADYARSLPPFLFAQMAPRLRAGGSAVVLAEEWHTADAVLHLDALLRQAGLRHRVQIFWTANNVFGFDRVDWPRLAAAARLTTVSRYMKHRMWALGVDPLVIPNGLDSNAFVSPRPAAVRKFRVQLHARPVLAKVARFDPDKRWLMAVDIVHAMKERGHRPLLVARGGMESHGEEVLGRARALGLRVVHRRMPSEGGADGLVRALSDADGADVVALSSHLDPEAKAVLYRASAAVLANSGHEPFGLVGLEAMAAGGVAATGCSGEDYAEPGRNALVLQTDDPLEFVAFMERLARQPDEERALRREGQRTARRYAWSEVVRRNLLPRIELEGARAAPLRAASQ